MLWEEKFGKQELRMFLFEMLILLDCQWKLSGRLFKFNREFMARDIQLL